MPSLPRIVLTGLLVFACSAALALTSAALAQSDDSSPWPKPRKDADKDTKKPATKPKDPAPANDRGRLRDEGEKLFKGRPQAAPSAGEPADGVSGWCVVLAVLRGDSADEQARIVLERVRTEGGLPEAFAVRRNASTIIAIGDFSSPDDPRALAELKRVQDIQVTGQGGQISRPYAFAILAPPTSEKAGGSPQYNLLRAKEILGKDALYTLQVGAYGRLDLPRPTEADLAESRNAAEQAVLKLRQEGEQAFYYHGPTMSMVTIGVFGTDDFDPQLPNFKSSRLRDVQKRHPLNMYNGQGVKEKRKGAPDRMQQSNLVAIPSK